MTREENGGNMKILVELPEWQYKEIIGDKGISEGVMINTLCAIRWGKAIEQEPTKNDIEVDCVSREQALKELKESAEHHANDSREEALLRRDRDIIRALPSVKPREPQIFKWCTDCREYDQEKHCCHRWSKVIRDTVEEMKQEYIEREVLDKIRAEIETCLKALDEIEKSGLNIYLPNEMSGRRLTYQQCLEFIDKYKAEIKTVANVEEAEEHPINENIAKGFEEFTKMMFRQGQVERGEEE